MHSFVYEKRIAIQRFFELRRVFKWIRMTKPVSFSLASLNCLHSAIRLGSWRPLDKSDISPVSTPEVHGRSHGLLIKCESIMGIPMDDIHTPTVPAGPVSGAGSTSTDLSKAGLTQLFDEKEKLEAELKILSDVLVSVCWCLSYPARLLLTEV